MKNLLTFVFLFFCISGLFSQTSVKDSVDTRFQFNGDVRFRIEHDWNSRKSDGSYREDRTRLRYRLRIGFEKNIDSQFSVGARIRTGRLDDQQGPHLTLGGNSGEFSTHQLGLEKAYLKFRHKNFWSWIGKNTYPFFKQNELLWNDNVYPEGVALGFNFGNKKTLSVHPTIGHFIFRSANTLFAEDAYLSSVQVKLLYAVSEAAQLKLNIGNLYFHNMPLIPDIESAAFMDYDIIYGAFCYEYLKLKRPLSLGMDFFYNIREVKKDMEIMDELEKENRGIVFNIKYGALKQKSDFLIQLYLASIGRFAVVDYLAQNDWARWDYSSKGGAGSRLSNFKGVELRLGYMLTPAINVVSRFYYVSQKIAVDEFRENGYRFRIDVNAKF